MVRIVDQLDQRFHLGRSPVPRHQAFPGFDRVLGGTDKRNHFIDVCNGDGKADQHMRAVARLVEVELGPPPDDVFAEIDKGFKNAFEVQKLRLAVVQGKRIYAETRL